MILIVLEIAVVASVATYLIWWQIGVRRRRATAWELLAAHLAPKWPPSGSDLQHGWNPEVFATSDEKWLGIRGAQGLWAMYENAGVMLDMANYAVRQGRVVDRDVLAALRSDALQIRICVLIALSKYACSRVNESTCATVTRAAEFYADMVRQMTKLAQANSRPITPGFAPSI